MGGQYIVTFFFILFGHFLVVSYNRYSKNRVNMPTLIIVNALVCIVRRRACNGLRGVIGIHSRRW